MKNIYLTLALFIGGLTTLDAQFLTHRALPSRIAEDSEEWIFLRDRDRSNLFYLAPRAVYFDQTGFDFKDLEEDYCAPYDAYREIVRHRSDVQRTLFRILALVADKKEHFVRIEGQIAELEAKLAGLALPPDGQAEGVEKKPADVESAQIQASIDSLKRDKQNFEENMRGYESERVKLQAALQTVDAEFNSRTREIYKPDLRIKVKFSLPRFPGNDEAFRQKHGFAGEGLDELRLPSHIIGLQYFPDRLSDVVDFEIDPQDPTGDPFRLLIPRWLPQAFDNKNILSKFFPSLYRGVRLERFPNQGFEYTRHLSMADLCKAKRRGKPGSLVDQVSISYSLPVFRDEATSHVNGQSLFSHAFSFRGRKAEFEFLQQFTEDSRTLRLERLEDEGDPVHFNGRGAFYVEEFFVSVVPTPVHGRTETKGDQR